MKLSKLSDDFKNKSLNLFAINVLILSVLPIFFYFILGYFSGFGFYIINAQLILNFQKITLYILVLGLLIPTSILFSSLFVGLDRNKISYISDINKLYHLWITILSCSNNSIFVLLFSFLK